jgi:hypothetical protein
MAIERFSREQFEAALPVRESTGDALWYSLGVVHREYTYAVCPSKYARIIVRSSITWDGVAEAVGQNSIRMYLEAAVPVLARDKTTEVTSWQPVQAGPDAYTTRQKGWEERLRDKLRVMWQIGSQFKVSPMIGDSVGIAGTWMNKHRPFASNKGTFRWLDKAPGARVKYTKEGTLTDDYKAQLRHYEIMEEIRQGAKLERIIDEYSSSPGPSSVSDEAQLRENMVPVAQEAA